VSDVAQGPGWWQASDGKWYPPQPPSGAVLAPPSPYTSTALVVPVTSGLAVASLVLSIIWLGGLGSLLAVICAAVSLSKIKRSAGQMKGHGLAVAGLVIGIVGVLGSVLIFSVLGAAAHEVNQQVAPVTLQMNQSANVGGADLSNGVASVTVHSLDVGVTSTASIAGRRVVPDAGRVFAVANISVCAGQAGSQSGPDTELFDLVFAGNVTVGASFVDAKTPALDNVNSLGANACTDGYVTFEIASGTRPTGVQYDSGILNHTYTWTVPPGS